MLENAREYVDSPEITVRKIKVLVIANKKAVEFKNAATSDCEDSDYSSYISPYQDVDIPDPEHIKISQFYKTLPNFFPLTLVFATVIQNYKELRCTRSKDVTGWANMN